MGESDLLWGAHHKPYVLMFYAFKPEAIRNQISYSNSITQSNIIDRFANGGVHRGSSADAGRGIDYIHQH